MLVNLSPCNKFRSMAEQHAKYMNKIREVDESKYTPIKFNDLFTPTKYIGVYLTDGFSGYVIDSWCKQKVVYNTKEFRKRLDNIPRGNLSTYLNMDLNAWTYGVADNIKQIIEFYIANRDNYFKGNHVILATEIYKDITKPCSGWRWHKWGEYIGAKSPKCEYLNDEPEIDKVICFSIYKVF